MANISWHSSQSSHQTEIESTNQAEANVLSIYAKFQLYPPYGF